MKERDPESRKTPGWLILSKPCAPVGPSLQKGGWPPCALGVQGGLLLDPFVGSKEFCEEDERSL